LKILQSAQPVTSCY